MKNIFISGGGSGGHIFPGLAIAEYLLSQGNDQIKVHFVGTKIGLEQKILKNYPQFQLHLISGGKLNYSGKPLLKIITIFKLVYALIQSAVLIRQYKPQFAISVGGYASGPFVLMCSLLKVPTAIWEPNAQPGLANRWLSKFVKTSFYVFDQSIQHLSTKENIKSGLPIRQELALAQIEYRVPKQFNSESPFVIFHFGGSQGSRAIGTAFSDLVLKYRNNNNYFFIHQCGSIDFESFKKKYADIKNVEVKDFILNMPDQYKRAHLIICRGGANTLTELQAYGLPSIVVPLPAADDHQGHNAKELTAVGAATALLQRDLSLETLDNRVQDFFKNPEKLRQLSQNVRRLYKSGAAKIIGDYIYEKIN
jgi:UDP-N-acetylglucosamine--N-acetylmuramyl-(pentapeptide) pyrophosphoryl-undecaprenol N-acetylglucosamine transferase